MSGGGNFFVMPLWAVAAPDPTWPVSRRGAGNLGEEAPVVLPSRFLWGRRYSHPSPAQDPRDRCLAWVAEGIGLGGTPFSVGGGAGDLFPAVCPHPWGLLPAENIRRLHMWPNVSPAADIRRRARRLPQQAA